MSGPSYVPSAPAATLVPDKVEDEGKPVPTAAASASSHSPRVTTPPETSSEPEEQEGAFSMAAAISPANFSQVDPSTEPCVVHDRSNHGTVEMEEVAENGVRKQQANSESERIQTEGVKLQISEEAFVVRAISASTSHSGHIDQRKPHHVRWHSSTEAKDRKPVSPLEVREKGNPQLSAEVGNGTFLTILPVEMSSRGYIDQAKEVKPCNPTPAPPVTNVNEHREHQQCSSGYQHVESPLEVASQKEDTKSVSEPASSKPKTSKAGRAKSDGAKESKRW